MTLMHSCDKFIEYFGLLLTLLSGLGRRKMLTAHVPSLNFLMCTLSCIRGTNNKLPTNSNFKSHLVTSLSIRLVQNQPSISTKMCLWCMRVKINNASSSNLKPGFIKSEMYSSTVLPFSMKQFSSHAFYPVSVSCRAIRKNTVLG